MIQNIFLVQKSDFVTFFFVQHEKYFIPLINHLFMCLEGENGEFKTRCISFLQFLLLRAQTPDHNMDFIAATLEKAIKILNDLITNQNYLLEIEMVSFLRSVAETFEALKGHP